MTNKEVMFQILYKAMSEGVAKLIKNGLAFTVMSMAIAGLVWGLLKMHELHTNEITAFKSDFRQMKIEHSDQLNELRREINACTIERIKDAARIARLEGIISQLNAKK